MLGIQFPSECSQEPINSKKTSVIFLLSADRVTFGNECSKFTFIMCIDVR